MLIPIQCEYYALEGLGQLLSNIELVRAHLNPGIAVSTILLTMHDGRTKLADQVADEVRNHFGELVLATVIPRNVRVSEAPATASRCSPTTRVHVDPPATSRQLVSSPSAVRSCSPSCPRSPHPPPLPRPPRRSTPSSSVSP